MAWTQQEIDFLEKNKGKMSYGQIAAHLKKTRGAVAGQLRRMNRGGNFVEIQNHIKGKKKVEKSLERQDMPWIKLVDAGPYQCRWIVGEPRLLRCCGAMIEPKLAGKPYCLHHHKLAYL